jgi:hypothetical protein
MAQPRRTLVRGPDPRSRSSEGSIRAHALEAAIREYTAVTHEIPRPFVWTKTADEILASVAPS